MPRIVNRVAQPDRPRGALQKALYPFAFYYAGVAGPDNLTTPLVMTLGLGAAVAGSLDSTQGLAIAASSAVLGKLADRLPSTSRSIVYAFLLAAFTAGLLAFTSNFVPLLVLVALLGFSIGAAQVLPLVLMAKTTPPQHLADANAAFQRVITVGSTVGLGVIALALWTMQDRLNAALAFRWIFLGGAALCILSALAFACSARQATTPLGKDRTPTGPITYDNRQGEAVGTARAPWSDPLKVHLLTSFPLFVGLGMAGTALPILLMHLGGPPFLVIATFILFNIAAVVSYKAAGRAVSNIGTGLLFPATILSRGIVFLLVAGLAFLTPRPVGIFLVVLLMAASGILSASVQVQGYTRSVFAAARGHEGEAVALYSLVTNLGVILGALLGGWLAFQLGAPFPFLASAILLLAAWAMRLWL